MEIGVLYLSHATLVMAELIVCSPRGLSCILAMRIRVSGSTSATKSLSSSVSVVMSLSESSGVK